MISIEDPIVAKIRRYSKQYSLKYENDLGKNCEALRERQVRSKRKVVTRPPRLRRAGTDNRQKI
ncbi:MAG: hypothetical protein D3918_02635 [Candidatus Electrothrix sp. AX2]|nr:hypothetical protein [Candidatus Electrothrix gigas]